jgi:hypothetical protein
MVYRAPVSIAPEPKQKAKPKKTSKVVAKVKTVPEWKAKARHLH